MSTQEKLDKARQNLEKYIEQGDAKYIDKQEEEVIKLERKLKKEEKEIKPHPACVDDVVDRGRSFH